ncbi:MAG TPA: CAP domain-containing protein [Acidobacteriaceae bacterium]|nr:CAP domain-containing protein [Acidobacteriaceae bacterium]
MASLPTQAQTAAEYKAAGVLFQSANRERVARGLQPLSRNASLGSAAQQHAERMAAAGVLSHQFPGEPDLVARIQQQGVAVATVAENVAEAPTAEQIHQEWMHSPLHRANLLDPRVNIVGFGIVQRNGELFAVEDFAHAVTSLSRQQQEQQVAAVLASRGLTMQSDPTIARTYCGDTPHRVHPLPRLIMNYTTPNLQRLPKLVTDRIAAGHMHSAAVGACSADNRGGFTAYHIIILLY